MTDPQRSFLHFAEICAAESPLYAHLCIRIAETPELLQVATGGQDGHPPPNLLLGAVHELLLGGAPHELRAFYPSVGGRVKNAAAAWPAFADFCRVYKPEIVRIVTTRRVQTNEVGRCGLLLPAFAAVHHRFGQPLHLIEVGASAGLALLFDQYRYEYSDGRTCGPPSSAVIRTELQGPLAPRHLDVPPVAQRVGVDLHPIDVGDAVAMRWLAALIWPEHIDRLVLQERAVEIARSAPPRILAGDAIDRLPGLLAEVAADVLPLVYHSHATYQMSAEWRAAFRGMIDELGARRDLALVALEWLHDDPLPHLDLTCWSGGRAESAHLADCHHHGRWLRWTAAECG
jgi:hypothetical protein